MEKLLTGIILLGACVYTVWRLYRIVASASSPGGVCCGCEACKTPCELLGIDERFPPESRILCRSAESLELGSCKADEKNQQRSAENLSEKKPCRHCACCTNQNCPNCVSRGAETTQIEN